MRERGRGCFYESHASGTLHRENLEEAARAWLREQRDDSTEHNDDVDEFAGELAELGVPEEDLERFRAASYDDEETAEEEEDVYLYPVNADAFHVFQQCGWQKAVISGPGGSYSLYDRIDAQEVRTVCEMLRIPIERWEQVLAGVRICEPIFKEELNPS